jgi:hypothetical protein
MQYNYTVCNITQYNILWPDVVEFLEFGCLDAPWSSSNFFVVASLDNNYYWRVKAKGFGQEICNIVACEGLEWVKRHKPLIKWKCSLAKCWLLAYVFEIQYFQADQHVAQSILKWWIIASYSGQWVFSVRHEPVNGTFGCKFNSIRSVDLIF